MDQITLKANINECIVENWQSNTGEVNARVMNVEMCESLCSCARQFVTFELADGTVYESLVVDGKAKIPLIEEPQFIKIGLYAENIDGDECEKRYSAHPANVYVNMGAYKNGASEPPKPTPGDYAELLEQIEDLEKGTIKVLTEQVNLWELETGIYYLNGGFKYTATSGVSGEHILIIYKPQVTINAVRYIHFCGGSVSGDWSSIDCGYTDGRNNKSYDIVDTSQITSFINDFTFSNLIPDVQAVKGYVKEYVDEMIGGIENGSY